MVTFMWLEMVADDILFIVCLLLCHGIPLDASLEFWHDIFLLRPCCVQWLDHFVIFMFLVLEVGALTLILGGPLCIEFIIIDLVTSWWCYVTFGVLHGLIGYKCSWIHGDIGNPDILLWLETCIEMVDGFNKKSEEHSRDMDLREDCS